MVRAKIKRACSLFKKLKEFSQVKPVKTPNRPNPSNNKGEITNAENIPIRFQAFVFKIPTRETRSQIANPPKIIKT